MIWCGKDWRSWGEMRFSSPSPWPLSLNVVLQSFSLKNGSIMFIMISTLISFLCLWQEEAVFFSLFGLQRIELIFWYSIYNNTYHKQYKEKFLTPQHFVNIYKMITKYMKEWKFYPDYLLNVKWKYEIRCQRLVIKCFRDTYLKYLSKS